MLGMVTRALAAQFVPAIVAALARARRLWPALGLGAGLALVVAGLALAARQIDARAEARGAGAADARWQAAAEAERRRQEIANAHALAEHASRVAALEAERERLSAQLRSLADAAAADPNAGRDCLGADSVRRLNAVRPRPKPASPR